MTTDERPDRLSRMWMMQRELQRMIPGGVVTPTDDDNPNPGFWSTGDMEVLRGQMLAIHAELQEAMDECGWKPWAALPYVNRDAFMSEMVDAWLFFMNLMIWVGMTPADLYTGYLRANAKNRRRHDPTVAPYDAVSTKCPSCKRDLNDAGVTCTASVCNKAMEARAA